MDDVAGLCGKKVGDSSFPNAWWTGETYGFFGGGGVVCIGTEPATELGDFGGMADDFFEDTWFIFLDVHFWGWSYYVIY